MNKNSLSIFHNFVFTGCFALLIEVPLFLKKTKISRGPRTPRADLGVKANIEMCFCLVINISWKKKGVGTQSYVPFPQTRNLLGLL